MDWWSLKVITSRNHQSPILEAKRGATIVRLIIDLPAPRLNVNSLPWFNTIRSFLAKDSPPIQTGFSPLGRLTFDFARNKGPPISLSEAFLKEEDLGLEDLERIVGRKVAAVHTYPSHLHPNEPRVGLQKIPDAQIRTANEDPSPP